MRYILRCRRGSRTAHEVVSYQAQENLVVNPLPDVYPRFLTPETGGHGCQFRHPTLLYFNEL